MRREANCLVFNIAIRDCYCQGAIRNSLPGKPSQKSFPDSKFSRHPDESVASIIHSIIGEEVEHRLSWRYGK